MEPDGDPPNRRTDGSPGDFFLRAQTSRRKRKKTGKKKRYKEKKKDTTMQDRKIPRNSFLQAERDTSNVHHRAAALAPRSVTAVSGEA